MKSSPLRLLATVAALACATPALPAQGDENEEAPAKEDGKETKAKDFRTFTAKNGKALRLRVVNRIDDERFTFETEEGKSFTLNIVEKLSKGDQLYLETWMPGAITDLESADLADVLEKMNYSGADLIAANNYFIVGATIGGKETKLVIDAGRNFSTLDPAFAKDLGVTLSQGRINFRDATGKQSRSQQCNAKAVAIGEVELDSFGFQVLEVAKMFSAVPANTKGAIGSDLLKKLNALLDYDGKRLYVRGNEDE